MNIRSRVVRYVNDDQGLPVFCTSIEKNGEIANLISTAITASHKAISDRANSCIEQCVRISEEAFHGRGLIYLVELSISDDVRVKVESAMFRAKNGDTIIFSCENEAVRERTVLNLLPTHQ